MVNGLPLPETLVALMRCGNWVHPGEDRLRDVIPFLADPVVFLESPEAMAFQSRGHLADDPRSSAIFHEIRGRRIAEPVELPWLDVDLSVFIAINKYPGDDVGIALDYRAGIAGPRVVASAWGSRSSFWGSRSICLWREVAPTFRCFAQRLELSCSGG
jgi:hypothetical protein